MRILVTGGAGYIGSVLVPMLLDGGHAVVVLDTFHYEQNSLGAHFHRTNLEVTVGDVRDTETVRRLVRDCEGVIPLAAIVGAPACSNDPVAATSTNRDAVFEMLKMLSPDQFVIMPTTNSAYGQGDVNHHCDETSPLNPLSQYAREKVQVEQALLEHARSTSLRLATVFGMSPRMRLDLLVNDFVNRALRDRFTILFEAGFYRNYIHVQDVSRLFLFALDHLGEMSGEIFNVGISDANLTKLQLCEAIKEQVPGFVYLEAPLHKDPDQRNYIVSNAKIEALGYRTQFSLRDGIHELVKGIPTLRYLRYANA